MLKKKHVTIRNNRKLDKVYFTYQFEFVDKRDGSKDVWERHHSVERVRAKNIVDAFKIFNTLFPIGDIYQVMAIINRRYYCQWDFFNGSSLYTDVSLVHHDPYFKNDGMSFKFKNDFTSKYLFKRKTI